MSWSRLRRLAAGWFGARDRFTGVEVGRDDDEQLVVRVCGEPDPARLGDVLASLVSSGSRQVHIDLADTDMVAGLGEALAWVWRTAQAHQARVTVHRAGEQQRMALRRYGLDRVLLYSDQAPLTGSRCGVGRRRTHRGALIAPHARMSLIRA